MNLTFDSLMGAMGFKRVGVAWEIVVGEASPLLNVTSRMHWRKLAKEKERWLYLIRAQATAIPKASGHRRVVIVRCSLCTADMDNVIGGAKECVLDVLKPHKVEVGIHKSGKKKGRAWRREHIGLGLIVDDSPDHVTVEYHQVRASKRSEVATIIRIEEAA